MIRIVLLAWICAVAAGCSGAVRAYEGAPRDDAQVAVILPENAYNRARESPLGATSSGGEVRVRVGGQALGGTNNRFEVLPGRHDLAVAYLDRDAPGGRTVATRAVTLPIDVQAGRTYAIRGLATWANGTPTVTLWAVDGTTRRTVASVVVPPTQVLVGQKEEWIIRDD